MVYKKWKNKIFKCDFGNNSFVYLGHIFEGRQLKIDPSKVDVIVEWPNLANFIEVDNFFFCIAIFEKVHCQLILHIISLAFFKKCDSIFLVGRKATKGV